MRVLACYTELTCPFTVIQEAKADDALAALKKMSAPEALVLRGGKLISVPSHTLVPGDVVRGHSGYGTFAFTISCRCG